MSPDLTWYARRLRRMSAREVAARATDAARRTAWAGRQVRPGETPGPPVGLRDPRLFPTPLPPGTRDLVPGQAARAVVAAADALHRGEWSLLGTARPDIADPDWFLDPVTGRRAPADRLAFRIDHRDEELTGNVKSVWELSRHHQLTVLASAFWLTGDESYAETVARQLRSWWAANPYLSGIHWTSGIELGIRLVSWAWVRRLLHDWAKVEDLFESNPDALRQLRWHQEVLAAFRSRGSSGNNHAVAESCGRLVAACAFPWFTDSGRWAETALRDLQRDLHANTFRSGVNRELASDYHRFVTELGLVAAVEATAAGLSLHPATWGTLTASSDAAAAMVDRAHQPPRQGDGDEGRALVLDDPEAAPWGSLLALASAVVGSRPWWPEAAPTVAATAASALLGSARPTVRGRPETRPNAFADAGMYLLRTPSAGGAEIWCRCDGGPHGFLSIAAHAHADALSVELRYDGTEVLVDPGTYCYHGEPEWRSYFRSTRAHNTVEVDGENQAVEGGPFLWTTQPDTSVVSADVGDLPVQRWTARHSGYSRLDPALVHERTVVLDRGARALALEDLVSCGAPHDLRLLLHLGPDIDVRLTGTTATLRRRGAQDTLAHLVLPEQAVWSAHRGETDPPLGWYSPRLGQRQPITTLAGEARIDRRTTLLTRLVFHDPAPGTGARRGESP